MAATRIAGVKQIVNPDATLRRLYKKILRFTEKLPVNSAYRMNVEAIICHRLSIVNQTNDPQEIEDAICCGRIEMLIKQAENEFELIHQMLFYKPWEPLMEIPPPDQWRWPPVRS